MPEGHLVHRHAREQHEMLAGRRVAVSSPQGRFDASAFGGRVVTAVEGLGKHLLYHWQDAPVVHVHLGMRGLFLRQPGPEAPPRGGTRLRVATSEVAFDLIAPIVCEVLDDRGVEALRASLGPDPLRADAHRDAAVERMLRRSAPVGVAVLDQAVWSGIGNAWRAELLFLARMHPRTVVDEDGARRLWDLARRYLVLGRDAGQVVSDPDNPDERWVYKRETCRDCGAPVQTAQVGGRTAYVCPVQQPAP